ncbi:MAG: hypothetical protein JW946_01410 [Candidatus Omnitrophica bacterium]|nr:hypothetical protein [Candidatus Omnitrophota bacterium]
MGKIGNLLIIAGIFIIIYAILGTFIGSPLVFSYVRGIKPSTAILLANSLLLLGAITKIGKKV